MKSENQLVVKKENLFTKILNFFLRRNNKYEAQQESNIKEVYAREDFSSRIKIEEIVSLDRLRELQYLIRNDKIKEEDISVEEQKELRKLYKKQINNLKESISNYKIKIEKINPKNA